MDLMQLYYFKVIAKHEHITKASEQLMISQSSLSRSLSRLESELGVKLFDRKGRSIELNDLGQIVLEHTNNIFSAINQIEEDINICKNKSNKHLLVASVNTLLVSDWLLDFHNDNDDYLLRHNIVSKYKICDVLLAGEADFIITTFLPALSPNVNNYIFTKDEFVLLVPLEHELAKRNNIFFHEAANLSFLALPSSGGYFRFIDDLAEKAGFIPHIVFEGESELLTKAINTTKACLVTLKSRVERHGDLEKSCHIVHLNDAYAKIDITISWLKEKGHQEGHRKFLNFIKNHQHKND